MPTSSSRVASRAARWYGRPDVLLKVGRPGSQYGSWSYGAADTKLARETRGGTILQLGLYSEMLEHAQGVAPGHFYVVTPADEAAEGEGAARQVVRSYRVQDYAAYFRLMKARMERAAEIAYDDLAAAHYPEPVDHCDICPWIHGCRDRRREDDHLSLVAGISRLQRRELEAHGCTTVETLARIGNPIPFTPERGAVETYERVRDQARVQVQTRIEGRLVYELIPLPDSVPVAGNGTAAPDAVGLARLPEPSPGDVFLDLEGDPLAADGGREYLFGLVTVDGTGAVRYQSWWAETPEAERAAFEAVVDLIMARADRASRDARLPLRAVRAVGVQAADGPLRDPRGRDRHAPARQTLRRSLRRRPPGPPRGRRALFHQEPGTPLRVHA